MSLINSSYEIKKYLILPSVPTPNGTLHLGHIGGPFLSADIFARHYQLLGHQTHIIAGTDSYESFVTACALKENKTPAQICNKYHELIHQDLIAFNIKISKMINPLSPEWQEKYHYWHNNILEKLIQNKATKYILENVPWNQELQRFTTGCWLRGQCPNCYNTNIAGYFCESCGMHFKPEDVIAAHDSVSNLSINIEKTNNLFMQLPNTAYLNNKGINTVIRAAYIDFIKKQNGLLRLTANSKWGLSLAKNHELSSSTIFNYGLMYAYFLLMGDVFSELVGDKKNAFSIDSNVITVCTFGFDNAVPFLASILGITACCTEYKPFDYYLINYFYHLNGSKFSTSRNHAIWAKDISQQLHGNSDLVRLFLALINVKTQVGNFETDAFNQFYSNQINWLNSYVINPLLSITKPEKNIIDDCILKYLEELFTQQHTYLQPHNYLPHLAAEVVIRWQKFINTYQLKNTHYFWLLKGFAILAYPFMPKLCVQLWKSLGFEGEPTSINFNLLPENKPSCLLNRTFNIIPNQFNKRAHIKETVNDCDK